MADWEIGDLAECVNVRPIRIPLRTIVADGGRYLELGRRYRVRGLAMSHYGQLCLDVGVQYGGKLAQRFVKVLPDGERAAIPAHERVEEPA